MATVDVNDLEIVSGDLVAKVGDELKRLFPETKAASVQFTAEDGSTTDLATVVATIVAELKLTATTANMETAINTAVTVAMDKMVDGAPEALDTLKELADKATGNSDLLDDLKDISTGKVDKVEGETLIAATLLAVLQTITAEKIVAWDKAQANVLEEVKVNGVAQVIDGNKAVDIAVPVVTVSATVPTDMKSGDMAFILHSAE